MWIEERTNSKGTRYVYYERYLNPDTGKYIRVSVTLNSNTKTNQRKAARLLLAKYNAKRESAPTIKNHLKGLTFEAVAREWIEATAPTVKETTNINHRKMVARIVEEIPENILFTDFAPATAEKVVTQMYYKDGYSIGYVSSLLIIIKAIMRYAKKAGYIDSVVPFKEISIKRRPVTHEELEAKQNKFLNHDELQAVLDKLDEINPRVSLAMEFIALTGLRFGELIALRPEDYNAEKKSISVNGTMNYTIDRMQRGTPKTPGSFREVVLNERANNIIRRFILDNRKAAKWNQKYKDRGYIFTSKDGRPLCLNTVNYILYHVHVADKHLTTHIFRHTHISMLVEMGLPFKTIMQRVGHTNPKTTLSIYTHVTNNMKKDLSEKLEQINI